MRQMVPRQRLQQGPSRALSAVLLSLAMLGPTFGDEPVDSATTAAKNEGARERALARPLRPAGLSTERSVIAPDSRGWYREQILRRVASPLESLSAYSQASTPGQDLENHILYEQLNRQVQRGVERATRRALERYLIESVELDRVFGALRHAGQRDGAGAGQQKRLSFDVGFYQALPKVELDYHVRGGAMSLSLGARGGVTLGYRDNRLQTARIQAGFDGEERYFLNCRLSF